MEPVTHLLTGAVLARTGFHRKTALATITMTLAAEAADIDILAYFKGSAYGFMQHRGITHTVFAVPVLAAIAVGIIWLGDLAWRRWRGGKPRSSANTAEASGALRERRWGWIYSGACVAALSHLLLDYTNNYGVRPLFPFFNKWYAWDIVFIFEPLIFAALLAALLLPWFFALINREIGARRDPHRGRGAAIAALLFMVALWGVRDVEHRRAVAALESVEFLGSPPLRVAAFPYMLNPFRWAGVAETSEAYISVPVDSLHSELDPGEAAETRYKPQPTAAAEAARNTAFGRFYLHWARFPVMEDEALSDPVPSNPSKPTEGLPGAPSHVVRMMDVRFLYPGSRRRPLVGYILLDSDLRPVEQGFEPTNAKP